MRVLDLLALLLILLFGVLVAVGFGTSDRAPDMRGAGAIISLTLGAYLALVARFFQLRHNGSPSAMA